MSQARQLIAETVERIFSEALDPETIARAESGTWLDALWASVDEAGLPRALLGAELGGAEGDWLDVFEVARACGRHSLPLPLVETTLAAWALAEAGLEVPEGPLGLALEPIAAQDEVSLQRIPWGRSTPWVVGLRREHEGARLALWSSRGARLEKGHNLALEPRDTLHLRTAPSATSASPVEPTTLMLYGALLRCGQMAGALERILDQSATYATERVQFGRPIGSFQILQQELARLAGQVAEATTASEIAFRAATEATPGAAGQIGVAGDPAFEIACAKVVVGEAAELGPRIAHQIHGAIGFTYEHSLHFATRRLWAWRAEFGTTEHWAARLGEAIQESHAGAIWPLVTAR